MKTMKNYGTKRLLSIGIILCMMLVMFPFEVKVHAWTAPTYYVKIDGQELDYEYKYLVNGERKKTGTLGIDGCTAKFEGTLVLQNYDGGSIDISNYGVLNRAVIRLIGDNIVTGKIFTSTDYEELIITATDVASLTINHHTADYPDNASDFSGIYGIWAYGADISIEGKAHITINASNTKNYDKYGTVGIFTENGSVTIKDDAFFTATCKSSYKYQTLYNNAGIYAGQNITINTTGNINIDSSECNDYSVSMVAKNPITEERYTITKFSNMQFKWEQKESYAGTQGFDSWPKGSLLNFGNALLVDYNEGSCSSYYRYGTVRDLHVDGGRQEQNGQFIVNGHYLAGDTATLYSNAIPVNYKFKEWKWTGETELNFVEGTSKYDRYEAKFIMPDEDITLTPFYESYLFVEQPIDAIGATGSVIPVSWELFDKYTYTEGAGTFVSLLIKGDDDKFTRERYLTSAELEYGNHSIDMYSDTAKSETYKLHYFVNYGFHESDEFTLTWEDAEISDISVSPATAKVQKGTNQLFTSNITGYGPYDDSVEWAIVSGGESIGTTISDDGVLTVAADETGKVLTVRATLVGDNAKYADSIVNVVNEPVTEYTVSVVNGTGDGNNFKEGDIVRVEADAASGDNVFDHWISTDMEIHEDSAENPSFDFTMPAKNVVVIATYKNTTHPEQLTGTVSISGLAKLGKTVTATLSDSNAGDGYYQWIEDISFGAEIGKTEHVFSDDGAGIGYPIICQYTSPYTSGSLIGIGGIITKRAGAEISDVTADDTANTLTGMTQFMEFSTDNGVSWTTYNEDTSNLPDLTGTLVLQIRYRELPAAEFGPATTFVFKESDSSLISIAITSPATKLTYIYGARTVDLTGLVVTGTYADATTKVEYVNRGMILGFNSHVLGSQTLTIYIDGLEGPTATYDIFIDKSTPATPAAPIAVSRTENSVTFIANSKNEFSKDDGDWQDSETFTGLVRGNSYTFKTRVKEKEKTRASDASLGTVILISAPDMTGTVSITGTNTYGETLTANITGLTNAGTPTYQWNRDEVAISGEIASAYNLVEDDIGKVISVMAIAEPSVGFGGITSDPTSAITKADGPAAPGAPTEESKTNESVTLVANALLEYSNNNGGTWQGNNGFNFLKANTSYTFIARFKETLTTKASAASTGTIITTAVSSGGSSSGGSSIIQPTAPAANGTIQVNYTASSGTAVLALPSSKVDEIIAKSKDGEVDIDLSKVSGITSAELLKTAVTAINEAGLDVTVKLPAGSITLNEDATGSIVGQAEGGSLKLELKQVAKRSLTDEQKEAVKSNDLVLDINISSGTKKISSFDGTLSITVPYSGPQPVAVWYLNDKGELEKLFCTFVDGTVSFNLDHLSLYVVGQDTAWVNPFADAKKSDWFYGSVEYAFKNGLMVGTSDTTFSPYMNTTRGMIVTILHRLEGRPKSDAANAFTDVGANKYYTDAVAWARDNIIVSGYGNGMFGPEDSITREQMAAILMNYAKYKGYDISMKADLSKFSDEESISPWAKDAISWANAEGLIQGSGSQLMPVDNALRCQVAAILQRFIETIAK